MRFRNWPYLIIVVFCLSCGKKPVKTEPIFKNVLILGNSITRHGPAPQIGWYGDWGMAASSIDEDFVHILIKKFKAENPDANVDFKNISDFERGYWNYDYSKLDSLKSIKHDLIIFRIGENVQDADLNKYDFKSSYIFVMEYFKQNNPSVKIIIASSFFNNERVETLINDAGREKNLPVVNLSSLSKDVSNTAAGIFSDPGVASHPSDKGMEAIANKIWDEIIKLKR